MIGLLIGVIVLVVAYLGYKAYKKKEKKVSKPTPGVRPVVEPRNPPVEDWEHYLTRYKDVYAVQRYRSPEGAREHYDRYGKAGGRTWGKQAANELPPNSYPNVSSIGGGFVFKPTSDKGDLAVLLPESYPDGTEIYLNDEKGRLDTNAARPDGRSNGNRLTFRFNKLGKEYPLNSVLTIGDKKYNVSNPANRVG